MGRGWRHEIRFVPFLFFEEKEKISTQRTQRGHRVHGGKKRREEGRTEILWISIVRAHPYKSRVGHPQVHLFRE
jgi:hypothetical protein